MSNKTDYSHPKSAREYLWIYFSGFVMGCAEIVPGVSGGTMAFVLGIYETLINAIKSVDLNVLKMARKLDIKGVIDYVPVRFLIALLLGMFTAVLALASLLHHLLEDEPTFIFAFFAGLIIASVLAVGWKVKWSTQTIAATVIGAVFAFWLVGQPEISEAGHGAVTLFLSGMVAICAMILPGISGSFILLILGQYDYVLEAAKDLDVLTLLPAAIGAVVGIIAFSRLLSWLLKHREHLTIAVLVGFMMGSLRKIWNEAADGVDVVSDSGSLDGGQIALVVVLVIVGFILVSIIDHLQDFDNPICSLVWKPAPKAGVDGGQPETA